MIKLNDASLFQQHCFIDNQWIDSDNLATSTVTNPANAEVLGTVPNLTCAQIEAAIHSAHQAHLVWKQTTAEHKSQVLYRWYELIMDNLDDLATILTCEQGKPLAEAQGEIRYAASFIQWYAEEAKRAYGTIVPSHKADARILVTKEPVGVVAAITPWNFPAAMITRKCGPAFAAGCSVVLKPAPDTPFTAMALAQLAQRAGLPAGLLQVMTADAERIGERFAKNTKVRKLSFTGSTRVGKLLMEQSAFNVKKLSLELGGNAPFIVFEDADLNAAVDGVMIAKFRNAGQTCVCANRIYVHEAVHDKFVKKLVDKVARLKVGDGLTGADIGPLINQAAVDKVRRHIEDAVEKGGQIQFGQLSEQGWFVEPHVITEMSDDMLVASDETFGPLAAIFRFSAEEEVTTRANAVESGLAAYCYTQSLSRAFRMSEQLESGMVGINEGLISTAAAPFGGVKESGLGREGGHQGLEEFLEEKYTLMGGIR
ncbi:NAD-dependent succinate-semialdehyde dehydrogenase [Vibrio sp. V39_P1S14PM300]|uniref:NAD-dependent succinate-semialdehyde dehydrogenase n=1 Tax=Vibrio sp. V39_P1S14PM300 TaxID=1938690 RepID=UPI0013736CAB|nr:NAD-dependent succinate-semialdehyde dehydrogenase [Vibrio sp. V39_P1S14PM300]NAX20649.1 succinate-semialdehyde dehydrogenase [Vibrio sp. V39_P1S14PM300]